MDSSGFRNIEPVVALYTHLAHPKYRLSMQGSRRPGGGNWSTDRVTPHPVRVCLTSKGRGSSIYLTLHLFAVLVLGLMSGSELNVAAFAHPAVNHQPRQVHIRMRSSLASLFGRVMPFWMAGSALLNLLLLLPVVHLNRPAWRLAAIAFTVQVIVVLFSLVGPVPINNRIIKWTSETLPNNWAAEERLWDVYHWLRTVALVAAFAILVLSFAVR